MRKLENMIHPFKEGRAAIALVLALGLISAIAAYFLIKEWPSKLDYGRRDSIVSNDRANPIVISKTPKSDDTALYTGGNGDSIQIVRPSAGQKFRPTDIITLDLSVPERMRAADVLVASSFGQAALKSPPYTTSFSIPHDAVGSYQIVAYALGGLLTDARSTASVEFTVEPIAKLIMIKIQKHNFVGKDENVLPVFAVTAPSDPGINASITVMGRYSDGSERDLTKSETGTVYASSNPSVAAIRDGFITAHDYGDATISVRNGEQSLSFLIQVRCQPINDFKECEGLPANDEIY